MMMFGYGIPFTYEIECVLLRFPLSPTGESPFRRLFAYHGIPFMEVVRALRQ